jgi:hypothetical protein
MTESPEHTSPAGGTANPETAFEPEFDTEPDAVDRPPAPVAAAVPLLLPTATGAVDDGDGRTGADGGPPPASEYPRWGRVAGAVAVQAAILRAAGDAPPPADDLVALAVANAWFDPVAGTAPADVGRILEAHGIVCHHVPDARFDDVQAALRNGDSPVVALAAPGNPGPVWGVGRCVRVVGVEAGPDGTVHVAVDDPVGAHAGPRAVELPGFLADWEEFGRVLVIAKTGPPVPASAPAARPWTPHRPPGRGISALLRDVHRDPSLRSWLPVESSVLMPVPERTPTGWSLWSLVSLVEHEERGERFHVPWGVLQWDWPSGRLVALSDLRRRGELADVLDAARTGAGHDWFLPADGRTVGLRETAAARLEQLLGSPDADLSTMTGLYERLVPPALRPILWRLAEGSAAWLQRLGPDPRSAARPPAAPPTAPVELGERLGPWLRRAEKLVDEVAEPALATRLAAVGSRRGEPYRVAVLGTGPALAAAVNELLGREVLPPRAPRPLPVPVVASTDPRLEVVGPAAPPTTLALEPPSWSRLTDDDVVRVLVDSDVLRELDGELLVVDTDRCTTPVRDACASCDIVLAVVNATSPLGMTERAMIENDCLGAHVPRVAVVVSQLHHIEPDERRPVLRYIANRAAKLGAGLEVAVADPALAQAGYATLAAAFPRLTARPERTSLRWSQVVGQLGDVVAELVDVATRRIEAAEQATLHDAATRRAAELRLAERGLDWTGVRNELQHRANQNVDLLRLGLLNYRKDLTDRLEFALQQSSDPRKWWHEEFEYHLRRDLEGMVRRYEHELTRRADLDAQWLDQRTEELFGRTVGTRTGTGADHPIDLDDPELRTIDARDVAQYKVGFRVVPAVAAAVVSLIGGPVGAAVAGAVAIVAGELRLRRVVDDQRALVAVPLRAAVDGAVNRVSDELSDRVRRAYAGVVDDVAHAESVWRDAELAGLPAARPDHRWTAVVDAARILHDDLCAALAQEGTAR